MHTRISLYTGISGHSGRFAARRTELEALMRSVPGLVSYQLLETAEGVAAVAVCHDRAGCEECTRRTQRWVDTNLTDVAGRSPLVVGGDVIAESLAARVHARNPDPA